MEAGEAFGLALRAMAEAARHPGPGIESFREANAAASTVLDPLNGHEAREVAAALVLLVRHLGFTEQQELDRLICTFAWAFS
jgi:hypothetical protein